MYLILNNLNRNTDESINGYEIKSIETLDKFAQSLIEEWGDKRIFALEGPMEQVRRPSSTLYAGIYNAWTM